MYHAHEIGGMDASIVCGAHAADAREGRKMPQDHATPAEANAASPNIPGLVPASAPPLASPTPTPGGDNGDRNEASHTRRHARSRTRTWVFGLAIVATIAAVSYAVRYFSY